MARPGSRMHRRQVATLPPGARALELGSGPGLLAECVLKHCPRLASYTLLDFSTACCRKARDRLAPFHSARFVLASFKSPDWVEHVGGPFDSVISMQAVHELRHKRHAPDLSSNVPGHSRVRTDSICDHVPCDDSARGIALYMKEEEQLRELSSAASIHLRLCSRSMACCYACEKAG